MLFEYEEMFDELWLMTPQKVSTNMPCHDVSHTLLKDEKHMDRVQQAFRQPGIRPTILRR